MFAHLLALLALPAQATQTYADSFDADLGRWEGGAVAGGVLALEDDLAKLELGSLTSFEATLLLTKTDEGALQVKVGDAAWKADYTEDGGLALGEEHLPFPLGHRAIVPDDTPVISPGSDYWDGANTLHCDVHYDEASATWFLFWTGEMASGYPYRQIGLATSTDGETWTKYAGNPVLTIDYDKTTVDGIHVHMPTVEVGDDGTWHMYYACYQDSVGNRLCHATSPDGYSWTPEGVALDLGAEGEFDSGSLRMPDVLRGDDGTWHLLYNGTDPSEHYGPTGYATSDDGWTWEKRGAITDDEYRLQGGGMVRTAYGVEQAWNCEDVFCWSVADPDDLATWEDWPDVVLEKNWAVWNSGYIQAPSLWLVGDTYHLWFNAYDYAADEEVIATAKTVPLPGAAFTLTLSWDGATLTARLDDGPTLSTPLASAEGLTLVSVGGTTLDAISLSYTLAATDSGETGETGPPAETGETGPPAETGETDAADTDSGRADSEPSAEETGDAKPTGCGCGALSRGGGLGLGLLPLALALARRRARRPASG